MEPRAIPSWPTKAWLWAKTNGHLLFTGLASIALGLSWAAIWMLWVGVPLAVFGLVWGLISAPRVHQILEREKRANSRALERTDGMRDIMQLILREVANNLGLDLSHTRLSVYTHTDDSFVMILRYSTNPRLQEAGRATYPNAEGFIGKVWAEGGCQLAKGLPKDRKLWIDRCAHQYGIPEATARNLSMQSRSLLGRRIDGHYPRHEPLGLIILESLEPNGLTGTHQDSLMQFSGVLMEVMTLVVKQLDADDGLSAGSDPPGLQAAPDGRKKQTPQPKW